MKPAANITAFQLLTISKVIVFSIPQKSHGNLLTAVTGK
jgi:hypothetical protein